MSKHVVVLMGGLSPEREVSFMSGKAVIDALNKLGYKVSIVDPDRDLHVKLSELKPDIVFNALHGTYGEDGVIPGILEMMGVPYTHSGVMASAVALNKVMTKNILSHYGIRMPEWFTAKLSTLIEASQKGEEPRQRPYVIKPVHQGSSIGVIIMHENDKETLAEKLRLIDWRYGEEVIVERYIPGKELSTTVVDNTAIGTLELRPKISFYDYKAKYTDGITDHIYPAAVPEAIYKESLEVAESAHRILNCRTLSRSDLRYDDTAGGSGRLYFLEINTHPGFTPLSIVPDTANRNGISFESLVDMLIRDARCDIRLLVEPVPIK